MKSRMEAPVGCPQWDPGVARRHAAFAPFAPVFDALGAAAPDTWPSVEALDSVLRSRHVGNAARMPLTVVAAAGGSAAAYERRIGQRGELGVRPGAWHDVFNVGMWAAWPATKAALNRRHGEALDREAGARRSPVRDALTGFDEDGIVVAVADPILADLARSFRWRELFVDRRPGLADAFQPFVIGHGLCEKLLAPYIGVTARALFVTVDDAFVRKPMTTRLAELDRMVSLVVQDAARFSTPADLSPLPVLGLPGWWPGNADPVFYDDTSYFRAGRCTGQGIPA